MSETPSPPLPAQHELIDLLRVDEHEWVLRTRFVGREGLTRIFRTPVAEELQDALTAGALGGIPVPEAFPWELRRVVEGYRVRAVLPPEWALPSVLDAGLAGGHPYLTRAWVDGEPLSRCWARLSTPEGEEALRQIVETLVALHATDVVYQDLKPDNVVRDPHGRCWIVDLESFRRIDESGWVPWTHLSPAFAAPEQLRGLSCRASDVYTFGRLVQTLRADVAHPLWRRAAEACVVFEWSERPSAAEVASWARGESAPPLATETVRVPDPYDRRGPQAAPSDGRGPQAAPWDGRGPQAAPSDGRGPQAAPSDGRGPQAVPSEGRGPQAAPTGPSASDDPALPLRLRAPLRGGSGETTTGALVVDVPSVPAAPPRPARRPWIRPVGAAALAGLVAVSVWGAADEVAREQAAAREALQAHAVELADAGWAALRAHKVDPAHNNDGDLSAALVSLQQAASLDPEHLDARSRLALGAVWSQRWHWDDATWDPAKYARAKALVDAARELGLTREAQLAWGLLDGARCRLDASASPDCSDAVERLDRAARVAPDWLAVEATWGAVVVHRDLAQRALKEGDGSEARGLANQALRRCRRVEDALPSGPVNNVELVRDCVIVAGMAKDTSAWWDWGRWLAEDAVVRHGGVRKREVALLVTSAAPECAPVRLKDDGWPRDSDQTSAWCKSMAEWVLQCDQDPTPRGCPERPRDEFEPRRRPWWRL